MDNLDIKSEIQSNLRYLEEHGLIAFGCAKVFSQNTDETNFDSLHSLYLITEDIKKSCEEKWLGGPRYKIEMQLN